MDYNPVNNIAIYESIAREKRRRGGRQKALPYSGISTNKCKIKDAIRKLPSGNHQTN